MNRQERELRKELLLLKGEALRIRLQLELNQWRKPVHVASEGMGLLQGLPRLKALLGLAAVLIPSGRVRTAIKWGSQAVLLCKLLARAFRPR